MRSQVPAAIPFTSSPEDYLFKLLNKQMKLKHLTLWWLTYVHQKLHHATFLVLQWYPLALKDVLLRIWEDTHISGVIGLHSCEMSI